MPRSMSEFEDASPLQVGNHTKDPILPFAEGNDPCDKVIREGEWMVEQVEEKTHEAFDDVHK